MPETAECGTPALDEVFALILRLDGIKPHPSLPKRLNSLLKDIQKPTPLRDPKTLAELIHALWISNTNAQATELMGEAIAAIAEGKPTEAKRVLERLVHLQPAWAEVYYKQAIVALMMDHFEHAIRNLGATLRLEPRHFAAISLFGQVCIDLGRLREARIALERAIGMNPHLKGVAETIFSIDAVLQSSNNQLDG